MIPEIFRRDKPLAVTGALMFATMIVVLFIAPFDTRTLLGLNAWVKPLKFLASVGVYVWSLAWFMPYVEGPRWARRAVSWGVSASMIFENSLIVMQSARGVRSHFNFETAFDGQVFSLMGQAIAVNSVLLALFAWLLFMHPNRARPLPYLWAIRLGTLILLAGSAEGAVMIANGAHAVGVADGGPGLRFLNFSTEGGDLRVAHLLGIHSFQIIPMFALFVRTRTAEQDENRQARIVLIFGLLYTVLAGLLFWQAMAGLPLVPA